VAGQDIGERNWFPAIRPNGRPVAVLECGDWSALNLLERFRLPTAATIRTRQHWVRRKLEVCPMPANLLYYALVALVIALVAGALGFGGIAGTATGIAQLLFYLFIVIFLVVLLLNFVGRRRPPI
jgi:uncharacterized membrane protein YtjA (UPF0391 family)